MDDSSGSEEDDVCLVEEEHVETGIDAGYNEMAKMQEDVDPYFYNNNDFPKCNFIFET